MPVWWHKPQVGCAGDGSAEAPPIADPVVEGVLMRPTPSRVRADVSNEGPQERGRLMSVYVAGETAYCAWGYPSERLLITAAPMGAEIADLINKLEARTPVFLEEAATESEEIDFAASFERYLPLGTPRSRRPEPATPPSLPKALIGILKGRAANRRRLS